MELKDIGYASRGTINWADLTGKIAEGINQIGVDRKKAIEENERILQETNTLLNKPLDLEKQSLTQFVLSSSSAAKEKMLAAKKALYNREITTSEYKSISANIIEHWQNFADQAKSADDRFKLYQERSTPDANGVVAASDAEDFLMEQYLNAADLNNKKMVIGKDGAMYLQAVDAEGKAVGDLIDYRDFARPENMQINKVNVSEAVQNITGNWKSAQKWKDLGRGGEQTTESVREQKEYAAAKINAVNAIVNSPKAALSVLVDNALPGGGIYYTNDADGQRMVSEAIATAKAQKQAAGAEWTKADEDAIKLSAIKWTKNSAGEFVPELTEEQMVEAKKAVDREIDMQMEYAISGSPRQPYSSGGGSGTKDEAKQKQLYEGYKLTVNAMKKSPIGATSFDDQFLSQLEAKTGKHFTRVKFGDKDYGIEVREYKEDKHGQKKIGDPIAQIRTAKGLSQYVFGGDLDQANSEWEQGKIYNQNNQGSGELD